MGSFAAMGRCCWDLLNDSMNLLFRSYFLLALGHPLNYSMHLLLDVAICCQLLGPYHTWMFVAMTHGPIVCNVSSCK